MDKLEPIIKHRFWILLGLVVPLSVFGYYSANGALKDAIDKRVGELQQIKVPSGNEANPRWSQGLSVINRNYEQAVNAEIITAWERQQARMIWPAGMQKYVPEEFRDPFDNEAGTVYAFEYPELLRRLHASIEPVVVSAQGKVTGGKVVFNEGLIPRTTFTNRLSIPSEMIWDAQEDIWDLQLIFDAIRNVNQPAENAAKSAVRAVLKVELWGGTGESSVKGSSAGSGSGEGAFGAGLAEEAMEMNMGMRMGMGGDMDLLGGGRSANVSFNPEEEFGTGGSPAGAQGGMMRGMMPGRSMMMPEGELAANPEGAGTVAAAAKTLRYVKESDSAPFRERGFYLSVLIDQRKIADFLIELTNSDWPIRIGRFHVGPNPEAGKGPMGGGMGNAMPLAGAGAFGGAEGDSGSMEMMINMAAMAGGNPFEGGGGEMLEGGIGAPTLKPTGESAGLLQQFDLVQLDLVGYITFYKPPPADVLAAVQQAVQDASAAAAAASGAAPADTVTPPADEGAAGSPGASDSSAPQPAADPSAPEDAPQPAADPSAAPADSATSNSSGPAGASDAPGSAPQPAENEPSAGTR